MTNAFNDPLLLVAKIATLIMQGFMAIAMLALTITLLFIPFFEERLTGQMREELADPSLTFPLFTILGLLALALLLVAMLFIFFGKLRQIIRTVGEGDPFVIDNAQRLSLMAWLMLGVQLLAIPIAGVALYLAKVFEEIENADVTIDAGLDLSGILMVIILFILARVFRQGAKMRDDLEGTV